MAAVAELIVAIKGDISDLDAKFSSVSTGVLNLGTSLKTLATGAGFVALGSVLTDAVKSAVDFETAMAGVAKTIDGTDLEIAAITNEIKQLSKEIPVSATEIAKVAEVAGQLGVGLKDLTSFTEVMIKFGASTNVAAEDAATSFAKLASVLGTSLSDVGKFAAVVVELGNGMATTESEILNFANRLSATASTIGIAQEKVLALAAAASSVGIEAEAGGTAFSTAFSTMFSAIAKGGAEIELFAKTAGVTVNEFTKIFNQDAVEALIRFSEGINKSAQEGKDYTAVLEQLGLGGVRTSEAILKMGSSNELFRNSMTLANQAMKEGTALNDEFAKRQETAAANMQLFQNQVELLKITMGDKFLPVITNFVQAMIPLLEKVGDVIIKLDQFDAKLKDMQSSSSSNIAVMLGTIKSLFTELSTGLADLGGKINFAGGGWVDALKSSIDIKWGEIFANAASSWENIKGKLIEKWSDIKATGAGWFDALKASISIKWGEIFTNAAASWENIKAKIVEKISSIKTAGADIFNALAVAISTAFDKVSDIVTTKWTAIKNAFAKGIDAVKSVLKIGSPSKVFIEIGTEVGNGFGIGVMRSLRDVEIPFQQLIPMAQGAITAARTGGSESSTTSAGPNFSLTQNIQSFSDPAEIRRQAELALRRFAIEFPIR